MKIYLGKSFSPNFQTWLRLELKFMIGNAKKNRFCKWDASDTLTNGMRLFFFPENSTEFVFKSFRRRIKAKSYISTA